MYSSIQYLQETQFLEFLLSVWESVPIPTPADLVKLKPHYLSLIEQLQKSRDMHEMVSVLQNHYLFPDSTLLKILLSKLVQFNRLACAKQLYQGIASRYSVATFVHETMVKAAFEDNDNAFGKAIFTRYAAHMDNGTWNWVLKTASLHAEYRYAKLMYESYQHATEFTHNVMLNAAGENHDYEFAKKIYLNYFSRLSIVTKNTMIKAAGDNQDYAYAKEIFLSIPVMQATDYTYSSILNAAIKNDDYDFAKTVYQQKPKLSNYNQHACMFQGAIDNNDYLFAKSIYNKISREAQFFIHNKMLQAAVDNDDYPYAIDTYRSMPHTDICSHTIMMIAAGKNHQYSYAKWIYQQKNITHNIISHSAMLKLAADNNDYPYAKAIYKAIKQQADIIFHTSMIVAAANHGDYEYARAIYNRVVTYATPATHRAMLRAAIHNHDYPIAKRIYKTFPTLVDADIDYLMLKDAEMVRDFDLMEEVYYRILSKNSMITPINRTPCMRILDTAAIDKQRQLLGPISSNCFLVGSALINQILIQKDQPKIPAANVNFVTNYPVPHAFRLQNFDKNHHIPNCYVNSNANHSVDVYVVHSSVDWLTRTAYKRDFTICALFCDVDGNVYDPTGKGMRDLDSKCLRMIDNPSQSLQDDPVRLLRAIKYIISGFKPDSELEKALHHWQPNQAMNKGHIYAVARKYLSEFDHKKFVETLANYGLLEKLFNIEYDGHDLEQPVQQLIQEIGFCSPASSETHNKPPRYPTFYTKPQMADMLTQYPSLFALKTCKKQTPYSLAVDAQILANR